MSGQIYKCRRCHTAPKVSAGEGMDGRPAINIRCKCKCVTYRCEVQEAKAIWNKENRPIQTGKP